MSAKRSTFDLHLGNVYVVNRRLPAALKKLVQDRPDVIAINEGRHTARKPARAMMARLGYRIYVAPYGEKRGRTDVVVYVHKRNQHLGFADVVISPDMPNSPFAGIAHERHAIAVLLDNPAVGKVAPIIIHPTPGPDALAGNDENHPIVRMYAGAMEHTSDLVDYLEKAGFKIVVAGDVQLRENAPRRSWNPYVVLDQLGLTITVAAHLDLIAADAELERVVGKVLAQEHETGSDHPFLRATWRRKRRR